MDKVCPIMSKPIIDADNLARVFIVNCVGSKCQFWITPYSTEFMQHSGGCSFELSPQMHEGLYRV